MKQTVLFGREHLPPIGKYRKRKAMALVLCCWRQVSIVALRLNTEVVRLYLRDQKEITERLSGEEWLRGMRHNYRGSVQRPRSTSVTIRVSELIRREPLGIESVLLYIADHATILLPDAYRPIPNLC